MANTSLLGTVVSVRERRELTSVRVPELLAVLDAYPDVRVLSLDCFDTLLWRSTASPTDVFFDLAHNPAFAELGMNAKIRVVAEGKARELKVARKGTNEVTLSEIYRAAFPSLDDAAVADLTAAEIEAEVRACAALPETVALIRRAKTKGLKVVIVSDTYLQEVELRKLLQATMPADAYAMIDRVFCSSAYARSKGGGLFRPVLDMLRVQGRDVLHVGDNLGADFHAARAAGIHGVHLVHHESDLEGVLRMQTTATSLLDPRVRAERAMPSPFRAVLARSPDATFDKARDPNASAVFTLGYASLGPLLYAFGSWLREEIAALQGQAEATATGGRVRPVFLLRDGYLPAKIARELTGEEMGPLVSMSRFAAFAASFRSAADVEAYVAGWAGGGRLGDLARQLLLTEDETKAILAKARKNGANAPQQAERFLREVLRPKILDAILARSRAYRQRMFRHLEATAGVARGDTLVFIDLGYEGTAQRMLSPVLADELDVTVRGLYLLAARVPGWEKTRRGLFDPSTCDDRLLSTLVTYVALLENLCASDSGSTVDYTDDGTPVLAASVVAPTQTARVRPVQEAALRFVRDARSFEAETSQRPLVPELRTAALGALARMLLMPNQPEVAYLAGFALDMNLGVDDSIPLFDAERGLDGLRRNGLFFLGTDVARASRIAVPVELRAASLELSLALTAQHRFGLEMTPNDMTHRRERVTVLGARGGVIVNAIGEARATHDGWFVLHVPMDASDDGAVGFVLGQRYAWVQIESVMRIDTAALYTERETGASEDLSSHVAVDGLVDRGGGLFEAMSPNGFLLVSAPPRRSAPSVCRIVFRPIVVRPAEH